MSTTYRPPAKWSRLKAVVSDPLEEVGLISKGDEQLLNLKTQERYFSTITTRYMSFCAATGKTQDLSTVFAGLSLPANSSNGTKSLSNTTNPSSMDTSISPSDPTIPLNPTVNLPMDGTSVQHDRATQHELSKLLLAMRKLREALVATSRRDAFAQRSLMFIIRATILTSTYEAYFPSLQRLLLHCHTHAHTHTQTQTHTQTHTTLSAGLSAPDLREFTTYHILDLACRQGALATALGERLRWKLRDERLDTVLRSLLRNDWVAFWRCREALDGYQRRLVAWADDGMRSHALKCIGRSYHTVEKRFVEKSAGRSWEELKRGKDMGWNLEGEGERERVVIRKVGPKKGAATATATVVKTK